jgi:hypothetical protein
MHCTHWLALSWFLHYLPWTPIATFLTTCQRNRDVFLTYTHGLIVDLVEVDVSRIPYCHFVIDNLVIFETVIATPSILCEA